MIPTSQGEAKLTLGRTGAARPRSTSTFVKLRERILDNCVLIVSLPVRQGFTLPRTGRTRCLCGGPCRAGGALHTICTAPSALAAM
jgi:hypothetical protein